MNRAVLFVLWGAVVAVGCGHDDHSCAQRGDGPAPGRQAILGATQGSFVTLPDGSTETLTGSVLVSLCRSPNTYFAGRVESVHLRSDSITVTSDCEAVGRMVGSTLYDEMRLQFSASVALDGNVGTMEGSAPYMTAGTFPAALDVVAEDFTFRLLLDLDQFINADRPVPYCGEWGFV